MKKNRTFIYMLWHDLLIQTGMILFLMCIVFVMYAKTKELPVLQCECILLSALVFMIAPTCLSYAKMEEFLTFHFSRKRFYRYQVWLSVIRAAELAVLRAAYQFGWQQDFIYGFLEGTDDTISMYHSVSLWELLLANFAIFFAVNLLQMVLQTFTVDFFMLGIRETPQLRLRIRQQEMNHSIAKKVLRFLAKIIGVVALVILTMVIIFYYQVELQIELPARVLVIVSLFVVCGILYLIGKRRYCPSYV